jgi:hypothetical protein
MTAEEINKMPFIFIVGMARSGTTLLRTIFDAGQEVVFTPESKLIIHLKQKFNHRKTWSRETIDDLLNDLFDEVKFKISWKIDKEMLRQKMYSYPIEVINFSFLIRLIYLSFSSYFEKSEIRMIGDKNPMYSIFIKEIIEVFPNAKFVHIVRDYRDCILSNKKLFDRQNVAVISHTWKIYNAWIDHLSKEYPDQFFRIRYEDLTTFPEKTVKELCEFTGMTFSPAMLDFHIELQKKLDKNINVVIHHTHPQLMGGISTENIGKWKKGFTEKEINIITSICGDFALRYNYEKYDKYSGEKFRFKSMHGFYLNIRDIFVIKGYYLLPYFFRKSINRFNRMIFDKTGFYTVFSHGDFFFELIRRKRGKTKEKEEENPKSQQEE